MLRVEKYGVLHYTGNQKILHPRYIGKPFDVRISILLLIISIDVCMGAAFVVWVGICRCNTCAHVAYVA